METVSGTTNDSLLFERKPLLTVPQDTAEVNVAARAEG
jgi:hypothetical protein